MTGTSEAQQKKASEKMTRPNVIKALNHPLRVQMLAILTNREASPKELAKETGADLGVVSYHARKLAELGCAQIVAERKVRGAVEHFYRSMQRVWFDAEEWDKLNDTSRHVATSMCLDLLIEDAGRSLNEGTFEQRIERHVSRTPMIVDEIGWKNVTAQMDELLETILIESSASAGRMAESGEQGIPVVCGMLAFEVPPREGASKARWTETDTDS